MKLTAELCRAISEVIKNHPEEVCVDDIVSCLLTTACAFSRSQLGVEKTLIQLTIQMAVVTDHDMDRVQVAVDRMKNSVAMQQADSKAAMIHGLLSKIGKQ
tara:strand:- start:72 stop:374 length:303 start_codon:yes stop_codon:yes gene_type:complete